MSFLVSGDCNIGLKNIYFKTDYDGEWKLLADNMDGINLICDEPNNFIQATPYEDFESYDFEEEKEMNKILQLYTERKEKEIHDEYEALVEEEYNKIEFVEVYKSLVDKFEKTLQELFEDEENAGSKYLRETGLDRTSYKYTLNVTKIKNEIREKYNEDERKELDELHTLVNEVETMLSLANNNGNIDNVKVQEILIKYDIIDKDLKIQA